MIGYGGIQGSLCSIYIRRYYGRVLYKVGLDGVYGMVVYKLKCSIG